MIYFLLDTATNSDSIEGLGSIHPLLPYISSFGLGVVVMALFLMYTTRNYKFERKLNKEMTENFIELAKNTLISLNDIMRVIDSLSPTLKHLGEESKETVLIELHSMKESFDVQVRMLRETIKELISDVKKYRTNK